MSDWHQAVAELNLVFAQSSEVIAPLGLMNPSIVIFKSCLKATTSKSVETWLVLVLALAINSLMRPPFGLPFVTLAHGEGLCCCEARLVPRANE